MPTCDLGQVLDFAAKNDSKIMYAITRGRMQKDPWATIFESGTWTRGEAESHTVVIGQDAAPADPTEMVMPTFTDVASTCGTFPEQDSVGNIEYTYKLQRLKGAGPTVCLWQGIDKYKESYKQAATSLANLVIDKTNADSRNIALQLSGLKATVNNEVNFYDTINGNVNALATPFKANLEPNTTPTLAYVKRLGQFMTTDLGVPQFEADTDSKGAGVPANIKVIAGEELLEQFRIEADVSATAGFLTNGAFNVGKVQLLSYVWEGPFRGIGIAKENRPIRLDTWPANGVITKANIVPPELPAAGGNGGQISVPNPLYWVAPFEIFFLIGGKGAFVREVLKESGTITLGSEKWAFPDQYTSGELQFFVPQGQCDAFKEIGFHTYQIVRAVRPQHPHYVMPIAFKRCMNQVMPYCEGNTL